MIDLIKQFAIDCAGQKEWDFPKDPKSYTFTPDELEKFAELIIRQCGYYADVFEGLGCPQDMDPTETKPSDYINKHFGVEE